MSDFNKQYMEAKRRVAAFDKQDGFKDRHLGTILTALQAGLKQPHTGAQYDALVMLEDLVKEQLARRKAANQ